MFRPVLCLIAVSLCSVATAQEPDWLVKLRAREGNKIAPTEIRSSDGWFSAKVPAKLVGKIEKDEDGDYEVELDMGADSTVYCIVVRDGLDLGDSLRRGLDSVLEETGKSLGKVEARSHELIDAGSYDGAAYLRARWIYRVDTPEGKQLGALHQIAFERPDAAVYCNHVEIGYLKTFEQIGRAFAESLRTSGGEQPYYQEVVTFEFKGTNIGVATLQLTRDADGDTLTEADLAMVMPTANALVTNDTLRREWVHADGSLINAAHVVVTNGELTTQLALEQQESRWTISGTHGGKEVSKPLAHGLVPGSLMAQQLQLREVLASEQPVGAEHSIAMWKADAPLAVSDYKTRITGKRGNAFDATSNTGSENYSMILEKDGTTSSAEMTQAGMTVKLERVYTSGSF